MRESTSLKLPSLEKGSTIFDYKVRKFLHLLPDQFPQTGEPSHGGLEPLELADGELCPSRHQVENKKTSQFHVVCCQSNQLWEHLDSQREQHQDRLPRGQLCQVIDNLSRLHFCPLFHKLNQTANFK